MLPLSLRASFRTTTRRAVHHAISTNPRLAHYQQRFPNLTPQERQAFAALLNVAVRGLLMTWFTQSLTDTLRNLWTPQPAPIAPAPKQPVRDPRQFTAAQLVAMMANSDKYATHRTHSMAPGTLQAPMKAAYPVNKEDENAAKGVYVAKGIQGFEYGPWGVVYAFDGRFTPYKNAEFVCTRDMTAEEALGWYDAETLTEAVRIRDAERKQKR